MSIDPRDPSAGNGSGEGSDMPRDDALRALYRQLPAEDPRTEVDEVIRAAARKAVGAGPRASGAAPTAYSRTLRWAVPLATAASLVLVVMMVREEHPEREGVPVAVQESAVVGEVPAPEAMSPERDLAARDATAAPMLSERVTVSGSGSATPPAAAPPLADHGVAATSEDLAFAPPREEAAGGSVAQSAPAAKATATPQAVMAPAPAMSRRADALAAQEEAASPAANVASLLPFTVPPGTRINAGLLSGYTLRERAGSEQSGAATFRVAGGEGAADAWVTDVAARLAAAGWRELHGCASRTFAGAEGQVTITFGPGELVLAWRAEGDCR